MNVHRVVVIAMLTGAVGLAGLLPVTALAQVSPGIQPANVMVVDASGKQVGTVIGAGILRNTNEVFATMAVIAQGRGVILEVTGREVERLGGTNVLLYESSDCSGPPLVELNTLVSDHRR